MAWHANHIRLFFFFFKLNQFGNSGWRQNNIVIHKFITCPFPNIKKLYIILLPFCSFIIIVIVLFVFPLLLLLFIYSFSFFFSWGFLVVGLRRNRNLASIPQDGICLVFTYVAVLTLPSPKTKFRQNLLIIEISYALVSWLKL